MAHGNWSMPLNWILDSILWARRVSYWAMDLTEIQRRHIERPRCCGTMKSSINTFNLTLFVLVGIFYEKKKKTICFEPSEHVILQKLCNISDKQCQPRMHRFCGGPLHAYMYVLITNLRTNLGDFGLRMTCIKPTFNKSTFSIEYTLSHLKHPTKQE